MRKLPTANNTFNYIDDLDKMLKEYNNSVHRSIEMTPKDAVHNRKFFKVCSKLCENYKPIYLFYKFDIGR